MPKSSPSEVEFASLLVYSVRGVSDVSKRSRSRVRDRFKGGDNAALQLAVKRIQENLSVFDGYFDSDVALVPVPRSSPIRQGNLWPSLLICEALLEQGLGGSIEQCLIRTKETAKAAFTSGPRKVATHLESLELQLKRDLTTPTRFLLVDDIVTSGSTLFAAASLFEESDEVRAFAVLRSISDGEIESPLEPVVGRIRYREFTDTTARRP